MALCAAAAAARAVGNAARRGRTDSFRCFNAAVHSVIGGVRVEASQSVRETQQLRRELSQTWSAFTQRVQKSNLSLNSAQEYFIPAGGGLLLLNDLRDRPGAKKTGKRLGRGIGSGKGKTAGRGHKGQKARSGRNPRIGFEGGQTPLRLTLPKRGFHNPFSLTFQSVNLFSIAEKIKEGRIDPTKVITMKTLREARATGKAMRDGVKLLGRGAEEFSIPINIEVSRVSAKAKAAVEKAGGTVTRVHYNKLGLRALLKPEWFVKKGRLLPRPARPPPKLRDRVDAIGTLPPPLSIYEKIIEESS